MSPLFKKFGDKYAFTKSFGYACFQTVRTFWLMCFIRSFDCYAGVRTTLNVHLSIVRDFEWTRFWTEGLSKIGLQKTDYIIVGAGLLILFVSCFIKNKLSVKDEKGVGSVRGWLSGKSMPVRFFVYGVLLFGIILFGRYGFGYNSGDFIYTRF